MRSAPKHAISAIFAIGFALLLAIVLGGCVTETHGTGTTPPPLGSSSQASQAVRRRQPPSNFQPSTITISAATPTDTNGNGFVDTIAVVVYVFGDINRYPLSIPVDGDFAFRLMTDKNEKLAEWIFTGEQVAKSESPDAPPGTGYLFGLRLGNGKDVLPSMTGQLLARFRTSDRTVDIGTNGAAEVRLGPLGTR